MSVRRLQHIYAWQLQGLGHESTDLTQWNSVPLLLTILHNGASSLRVQSAFLEYLPIHVCDQGSDISAEPSFWPDPQS